MLQFFKKFKTYGNLIDALLLSFGFIFISFDLLSFVFAILGDSRGGLTLFSLLGAVMVAGVVQSVSRKAQKSKGGDGVPQGSYSDSLKTTFTFPVYATILFGINVIGFLLFINVENAGLMGLLGLVHLVMLGLSVPALGILYFKSTPQGMRKLLNIYLSVLLIPPLLFVVLIGYGTWTGLEKQQQFIEERSSQY